jgi:pimeloyl-ACP methyl ester carboxylesterase
MPIASPDASVTDGVYTAQETSASSPRKRGTRTQRGHLVQVLDPRFRGDDGRNGSVLSETWCCAISIIAILQLAFTMSAYATNANGLDGKQGDYHGFQTIDFEVNDRHCRVAVPKHIAPGKPWVWRARFWGHEPQTDIALLGEGFHVAYTDVGALFGNDDAVSQFAAFHAFMTEKHGFAQRPAIEAMSRGGLIAYNFASSHPDKVSCIYGDAPVCDFKSWPGGLGDGVGSKSDWAKCLEVYGLDEASALEFKGNPIDRLAPIAAANIPLLNICGDADKIVPMKENTDILAERYRALGGNITVIAKEGIGHHPHSLENPTLIVDFILEHSDPFARDYHALRRGLTNAGATFTQTGKGRVAYLGGSITEMKGWRELTCAELEKRFPETEFDFVHAGISSTDSTLGAFRLTTDAFGRGPVDLLFMDHSVNDHHNSRPSEARIRAVEGIIRQAHSLNPNIDIIQQYFVEPYNMEYIKRGDVAPEIADHNRVTAYLDIPAIDLAREVTERIRKGDFTWEQFKDLHPSPFGHDIYAARIANLFDTAWGNTNLSSAKITAHTLNPAPLDPLSYSRGRYIDLTTAKVTSGWTLVPTWKRSDKAGTRKQFVGVPTLEATGAGAKLTLGFEGTAVGLLVTAGPDVGILEFSIDGKAYPPLDQFTQWSEGLHIPWAYVLADELPPGNHTLTLTTSDATNEKSAGNACRIIKFFAN